MNWNTWLVEAAAQFPRCPNNDYLAKNARGSEKLTGREFEISRSFN
jgi:hypothetical protein